MGVLWASARFPPLCSLSWLKSRRLWSCAPWRLRGEVSASLQLWWWASFLGQHRAAFSYSASVLTSLLTLASAWLL